MNYINNQIPTYSDQATAQMMPDQIQNFPPVNQNQGNLNDQLEHYKQEHNRLFLTNQKLQQQVSDMEKENRELQSHYQSLEKQASLAQQQLHEEQKHKRHRRTAQEIDRNNRCPVDSCQKNYGSEGSLAQHIKLKHPDFYSQISHNITQSLQNLKNSRKEDQKELQHSSQNKDLINSFQSVQTPSTQKYYQKNSISENHMKPFILKQQEKQNINANSVQTSFQNPTEQSQTRQFPVAQYNQDNKQEFQVSDNQQQFYMNLIQLEDYQQDEIGKVQQLPKTPIQWPQLDMNNRPRTQSQPVYSDQQKAKPHQVIENDFVLYQQDPATYCERKSSNFSVNEPLFKVKTLSGSFLGVQETAAIDNQSNISSSFQIQSGKKLRFNSEVTNKISN